ncbi:hypothetical protein [Acidiferrobacter sp.]|uniref:hypothetical protein n=1 Tax=Acidiferrobacter sp. TaxID=1872107 RepID=UPI0026165107|nr:hypothetical protein [Acidiferrobacter sp.]
MPRIEPAHERKIGVACRSWQVVHRLAADTKQPDLAGDGLFMFTLDHRFALSNPALVSARAKT